MGENPGTLTVNCDADSITITRMDDEDSPTTLTSSNSYDIPDFTGSLMLRVEGKQNKDVTSEFLLVSRDVTPPVLTLSDPVFFADQETGAYTVTGTALNVVMNICGAYPLSKRRLKGRSVLMFLFTFTMFFSGGMVPTYLLISRLHLLDTIWAILLPSAVGMYNIIIMRTYFQTTIPQELEDAAEVDGCTNFRFLLSVALPLSRPVIVVIALYYGVGRWNDYFAAMMYLTKRAMYPLQLVLREILLQNQAGDMLHVATDAGYADRMIARMGLKYAVIVISTLPILLIFPFVQRFFAKGVMIGAIKG